MEDSGFKKFEFDSSLNQQPAETPGATDVSGYIRPMKKIKLPKIFGKKGLSVFGVILIIFVLVSAFIGFKAFAIYNKAQGLEVQARKAADAAKSQNIVLAKEELVKTREEALKLEREMGTIAFAKYIPLLGLYVSDADHIIKTGIYGINAAIITADSLIPYADVLGLKGEGSFTGGSAEERIRTAVKSLEKVVPKIDDIEKEVIAARNEIDQVDPGRYPNFGPFKKIRTQIASARSLVDDGALAVEQGKPLIKVLPELLGGEQAKKYLILFQNDGELRPTGGFLTYYAIFRVDEGVIHIDSSNDIYKLDDSIASHPKAPEIILDYLPKVNQFYIRDSNLSPDFVTSMKTFREFYEDSSLSTEIDGIISIDTEFLVHIIKILGGVEAGGQKFTAEDDPRCNCPQVVYQLELNTTKPVGFIRENRKAIVGELLYATMTKALQSSPKLYWGPLFQQAVVDANEKHILFDIDNADANKGLEALNWTGKIKEFDGDYLHVNDANFAGAKSNFYINQSMRIDYNVAGDGTVTKTVAIDYKNPQAHSDCNLESGGLCLNATLRDFQRFYVPKGSILESSKGSEVKVATKEDLGKTYFESFFTVKPLGKSTITYTYKLPFKVEGGNLPVLIQKQPGVEKVSVEIYVNGKKVEMFDLRTDKQLNLKV